MAWPDRVPGAAPGLDWSKAATWTFEPLDDEAFPAVALAREAAAAGGTAPAVYNAANEECVAAFMAGSITFPRIVDTVARIVSEHDAAGRPSPPWRTCSRSTTGPGGGRVSLTHRVRQLRGRTTGWT